MIKIFLVLVALGLTVLNCSADNPMQPVHRSSITQNTFNDHRRAIRGASENGNFVLDLGQVGNLGFFDRPNNKRARKMSAFIPMRGRKDGGQSSSRFLSAGRKLINKYPQLAGEIYNLLMMQREIGV